MPAHVARILHSLLRSLDRDVEMQDLFARAELFVERDGRVVAVIGLHVDDPAAARRRDFAQMLDQPRRDVPSAMLFRDGKIVDVEFASRSLELVELVCDEAAEDLFAAQCNKDDDMVLRQNYVLPDISELPSFYFRRNIAVTVVDERDVFGAFPYELVGIENIMWSSDYPHPTTTFPTSRQAAAQLVAPLPPNERVLITSGNAQRIFNLDTQDLSVGSTP